MSIKIFTMQFERKGNICQRQSTLTPEIFLYKENTITLGVLRRNTDFSESSWECKDPIVVSSMVESTSISMWKSSLHGSASSRTYHS